MSNDATVLAVCVNWNGAGVLPQTLAGLRCSDFKRLEILVVDNASSDGSAAELPAEVGLLRLPHNGGYGAALNRAVGKRLESHCPDFFLLLNNDLLLEPDLVTKLVAFAADRGPAVYGPKILLQQDRRRLEAAWGHLDWSHVLARFEGKGQADSARWSKTRRVELLLGGCLLVHREVFKRVGSFDETFFLYHEEVDWLWRVGQAGLPVYFCPFARAYHYSGFGSRRTALPKAYWVRRNALYFLRKHRPGPTGWLRWSSSLLLSLGFNLAALRWRRIAVTLRALRDGSRLPVEKSVHG